MWYSRVGMCDSLRCFWAPTFYTFLTYSHLFSFLLTNYLWSICNWCTYHKIISAKLPLWPARGTWHAPGRVALSTRIFPGQCKLWQIPSSCIMCSMLISLILKSQKGLLWCWRACWLIEGQENNICHHPLLPIQLWPPSPTAARQLLLLCGFQTRLSLH